MIFSLSLLRVRWLAWAFAWAALACTACGPSFQAVYECEARFEHCYALDERAASAAVKRACWREWLGGYTYGQPRDRVEYATARVGQLTADAEPASATRSAAPVGSSLAPALAPPSPTNAFAPPPSVASAEARAAPAEPSNSTVATAALPVARTDCTDGCGHRWTTCREVCRAAGCEDCDRSYRACMPACTGGAPAGSGGMGGEGGPGTPGHPPRSLR